MRWTKDNLDITFFSGSGAGGQHRNKHQNCVRIKDKETGLIAIGQDHKSRKRNIRDALARLAEKLVEHHYPKEQKERAPVTEVVRTYNEPDNRVVDHGSGESYSFDKFDLGQAIVDRKRGPSN